MPRNVVMSLTSSLGAISVISMARIGSAANSPSAIWKKIVRSASPASVSRSNHGVRLGTRRRYHAPRPALRPTSRHPGGERLPTMSATNRDNNNAAVERRERLGGLLDFYYRRAA